MAVIVALLSNVQVLVAGVAARFVLAQRRYGAPIAPVARSDTVPLLETMMPPGGKFGGVVGAVGATTRNNSPLMIWSEVAAAAPPPVTVTAVGAVPATMPLVPLEMMRLVVFRDRAGPVLLILNTVPAASVSVPLATVSDVVPLA